MLSAVIIAILQIEETEAESSGDKLGQVYTCPGSAPVHLVLQLFSCFSEHENQERGRLCLTQIFHLHFLVAFCNKSRLLSLCTSINTPNSSAGGPRSTL